MLQVPEQAAGQQMRCPLCNNTFTVPPLPDAPSLAPSPPPPPPASPQLPAPAATDVFSLADDHNPPLPVLTPAAPPPLPVSSRTPAPPPPPPVVGDYTKMRSIVISPRIVPWIAPIAIFIVFLLTFTPWLHVTSKVLKESVSENAWNLGFDKGGSALFVLYDLLVVFGLLAAIPFFLMELKVLPDTPTLRGILPWRALIVLGFVGLAYLLLCFHLIARLFEDGFIWLSFWGWLATWIHFVAVIALLLEMWLQLRGPTRPPPRIDIHM
jgi:hypothetical protein